MEKNGICNAMMDCNFWNKYASFRNEELWKRGTKYELRGNVVREINANFDTPDVVLPAES
jgi:hypothetical protein